MCFMLHRWGSKEVEGGRKVKGIPSGFWHPTWLTRDFLSVRQGPSPRCPPQDSHRSPGPTADPATEGAGSTSDDLFRSASQKHGGHLDCRGAGGALPQQPRLLPAVETPAVHTHQAPSLSASVQSSCPVQRGGRVEGTPGGLCLPSLGLKNKSKQNTG